VTSSAAIICKLGPKKDRMSSLDFGHRDYIGQLDSMRNGTADEGLVVGADDSDKQIEVVETTHQQIVKHNIVDVKELAYLY
jgi:hypothetical protein